jgi:cobalamin synthase
MNRLARASSISAESAFAFLTRLPTAVLIEQEKRGSPFWVVTTVHAFYNLIALFALSQLV